MFDVFGNFDSVEELNACAKGLLEEQDLEHLKVLAEENGIQMESGKYMSSICRKNW